MVLCALGIINFSHFSSYFYSLRIRPRVLIDVSRRDTKCNVLGIDLDFPVCIAPTAMHKMAHFEGEIATAKGKMNENE